MTAPKGGLPLEWVSPVGERTPSARLHYRGPLAPADRTMHLHLGFDGAGPPFDDVVLERDDDGGWVAEVPGTGGHLLLDCAVSAGDDWDNNLGANYRLWLGVDPVDAHVHARTPGLDPMGFASLRTALASGGMTHALVSWQDNAFVDRVSDRVPWLTRLVWVRPGGPSPDDVRRRLADGAVGLKLHPSFDEYPADTPGLDPYLEVAAEAGVPVTVHTAPGPSDPDLVRSLAERFPRVPVVLYHTFLGLPEGRRRAARHAQQLPNLYLETSWCRADEVRRLIDEVGPDRVLFGSDAAVDGTVHFVRQPPNVEMIETYNEGLLSLARTLPADTFRAFVRDNTRRLFRLTEDRPAPSVEPAAGPALDPSADMRILFAAALAMAERVVAHVVPDDLDRPTPCTEWAVRDLLGHLVATVSQADEVGRGAGTAAAGAVRPERGEGGAATFAAAARKARAAWAVDASPPADVPAPWGPVPGPVALSGFVLELVAHTHDLAVSLGRTDVLDRRLGGAALRIAERLVPAGLRRGSQAYAEPVPAPPSADGYVRLAALLGRPRR